MTLVVVTDQPELSSEVLEDPPRADDGPVDQSVSNAEDPISVRRAGDDGDPDAVETIEQPQAAAREEAAAPTSPQVAWADSSEPAVASEPDVDATPTRSHYTEEELALARSLSLPEDRAAALCSSADPETAAASQVRHETEPASQVGQPESYQSNSLSRSQVPGARNTALTSPVETLTTNKVFLVERNAAQVNDWPEVLRHLQREKKRAIARSEEHYINRSLYCLQSSSPVRERLIKLIELPLFSNTILFLIILNCVTLALDDPICRCTGVEGQPAGKGLVVLGCKESEKYKQMVHQRVDFCEVWGNTELFLLFSEYFFTVVFTIEVAIKIVARGLILHKHAYLRDNWNCLDLVIVSAGLLTLAFPDSSSVSVSTLRTFRVLRPLRTMTRVKGMKPVINTFMRSFKEMTKVLALLITCSPSCLLLPLPMLLLLLLLLILSPRPSHAHRCWPCSSSPSSCSASWASSFYHAACAVVATSIRAPRQTRPSLPHTQLSFLGFSASSLRSRCQQTRPTTTRNY